MKADLQPVVVAALDALGLDLFELTQRGTKSRPVIEVRIDRRDGEKVTVDDCARASRAIEAQLDAGDLVAERYVLEVSSPGMDRPLRSAADWRRFVGRSASVNSPALHGRADVEIVALDGEPGAEVAVLRDKRGTEHRISLAEVTDARLAFHW